MQQGFTERWGQNSAMVTSFADGSKFSEHRTMLLSRVGLAVVGDIYDLHARPEPTR